MITTETLFEVGVFKQYANKYAQPLSDTMVRYEINTPKRIQHFLSQVLHESMNLYYVKEIASGKAYEGRKDLGNINAGDGVRYKGRGFIQITGRANYASLSKDLGVDFISNPELLETPEYAALSAGWFWNKKGLNKLADKDDAIGITKIINGGKTGLTDRLKKLSIVKSVVK